MATAGSAPKNIAGSSRPGPVGLWTQAGVFELLDLNRDGHLSREEFALLWRQYWMSDDPGEPGNWLCGRFATG